MKKNTKSIFLKVAVIVLAGIFVFGGLASSAYYLYLDNKMAKEYEAAFNQYLAELEAAQATMSATASISGEMASASGELLDQTLEVVTE